MIQIIQSTRGHEIVIGSQSRAWIPDMENAVDTFTPIEKGAWKWRRHTHQPVSRMRMELILTDAPSFTMIPAVSYNGNGWGDTPEYVSDRDTDGTPWSFASHRVTIPSCTYSENEFVSLALMAEADGNSACSLYKTDEVERHVLIFPEEEGPRTLHRHFWDGPFQGTMEPRTDFEAIILAIPSDGTHHRYKGLLDFAWRYYGHAVKPQKKARQLYSLSVAYARYLLQKEKDGFVGFTNGAQWQPRLNAYQKLEHNYEIGWVGQNASLAAAFLHDYLISGDQENLKTGTDVLDAWLRHTGPHQKFLSARINYPKTSPSPALDLEKMSKEDIDPWDFGEAELEGILARVGKPLPPKKMPAAHDACNLGTGAEGYFEAYDLLQQIGIDKPEYLKAALDTCDFALASQDENGALAKSWDKDGNVLSKKKALSAAF